MCVGSSHVKNTGEYKRNAQHYAFCNNFYLSKMGTSTFFFYFIDKFECITPVFIVCEGCAHNKCKSIYFVLSDHDPRYPSIGPTWLLGSLCGTFCPTAADTGVGQLVAAAGTQTMRLTSPLAAFSSKLTAIESRSASPFTAITSRQKISA